MHNDSHANSWNFARVVKQWCVWNLIVLCCVAAYVFAQTNDKVQVDLQLLGPINNDTIIGSAANIKAALRLNTDVIHRVMLKPDDLLDADIQMELAMSDVQQLDVLATGNELDKTIVDLAQQPALQAIELTEGQSLCILIWRSQWHYNGGGSLENFTIKRISDGKTFALPDLSVEPSQYNDFGFYRLMAMSTRDKFPTLKQWEEMKNAGKTGVYQCESSSGHSRLSYKDNKLDFFTNGRAKFDKAYDWAPSLVIEPRKADTIALSGKINIWSGNPKDKANITWAVVRYAAPGKQAKSMTLQIHRALRPILDGQTCQVSSQFKPGVDYDTKPLFAIPFDPRKSDIQLDQLADTLKPWLDGKWENHGIVMQVVAEDGTPPALKIQPKKLKASITVVQHPSHNVMHFPVKNKPDTYVKAQGNRLVYGDQRLRLWGVAGGVGDPSEPQRLNRIGFNAIRLWPRGGQQNQNPYYPKDDGSKGVLPDSELLDQYDRYVAAVKQQGMFIMCPFIMRSIPVGHLADDQSFVAGGDDWQQWKQAVLSKEKIKAKALWQTFDERLIQSDKQHIHNLLNHVNPYTNKRYAEEETIAVWELDNEAKIIKVALEEGFDTWPDYFKDKFQLRFNQWLSKRYASTDALSKAWGKLDDGESLEKATVMTAPIFPQRTQYPQARGDDFVHFVIDLVSEHYKQLVDYARSQAPTGVGVNVQPFSFDTQYRPNTPWQYSVTQSADVANFGMYFFSLSSTLNAPPSMYVMDSHTLANKPTVIYETNSGRPGPYRVEHAYRCATLASWQDWDAVFWHYYHSKGLSAEAYLALPLPYQSKTFYWSAVEFEKDPVMISTIGLAGQIFLHEAIKPASNPVQYHVGRKGIFSYDHWNGISLSRATFERGATLTYEPDADFDVNITNADPQTLEGRISKAIQAGDQITWDWPNGRLIVDTPTTKIYVGKTPGKDGYYQFSDGISVGQFDTDFAAIALVSADNRPLTGANASSRVFVNARFDARNTGFDMDMKILDSPSAGNPIEQAKYIRDPGHSPIIETPVAFTVAFPHQLDATFNGYDAAQRLETTQSLTGNQLSYTGKAMFAGELLITHRGQAITTPTTTPMQPANSQDGQYLADASGHASDSNLWHPVAPLNWGDNFAQAHRIIRESPLVFTNLTSSDTNPRTIQINDAQVLYKLPAEIKIYFTDDHMTQVSVKFTQPPALNDVLSDFNKRFGKPTQSKISTDAFAETRITWAQQMDKEKLNITLTENQGVMQIIFER